MMSSIAEIVRDLLIFVAVMTALLIAFVVIVSRMPESNPLKRVLSALSYRLGATVAAGVVAIPLEPIPGIDVLYDLDVPIALIWYWYTFFRDARRLAANPRPSAGEMGAAQENIASPEMRVRRENEVTHKDR